MQYVQHSKKQIKARQMLNTEKKSAGYKCQIKHEQKAEMEKSQRGRQMGD